MATGQSALAKLQRSSQPPPNDGKKAKLQNPASSSLSVEERLRRLEEGQSLHSQVIVQQGHRLNRVEAAVEVIIWIQDNKLKKMAAEAHNMWKEAKPQQGPHPMGGHGHVVHALILQANMEAMNSANPDQGEQMRRHPQFKALKQFLNISDESQTVETVTQYLNSIHERPMTECVQSCRPVSKRKMTEDKPWGWSVIYESGLEGSKLRDFMLTYAQPLHAVFGLVSVRKGVPREDRNLKKVAGMVAHWGSVAAPTEDAEAQEEEELEDDLSKQTPMKDGKRGRK